MWVCLPQKCHRLVMYDDGSCVGHTSTNLASYPPLLSLSLYSPALNRPCHSFDAIRSLHPLPSSLPPQEVTHLLEACHTFAEKKYEKNLRLLLHMKQERAVSKTKDILLSPCVRRGPVPKQFHVMSASLICGGQR